MLLRICSFIAENDSSLMSCSILSGVGLGGFRVHTQMDQKLRQGLVPVSMLAAMAMPVSVRVMSPSLSMVI